MLIQLAAIYIILIPLSLLLTYFSLPGNNGFASLVWFCIIPIFFLLEYQENFIKSKTKKVWSNTLLLGGWGLSWWCFTIWWLIPAATAFIGVEYKLALTVFLIFCLLLSLPYVLSGYLWQLTSHSNSMVDILAKSGVLTALIGLLSWAIPANLTSSLFEHTVSIQIVSITGVSGLVFCVLITNIGLAKGLVLLTSAKYKQAKQAFACVLISFFALHLIGYIQLNYIQREQGEMLNIAYIQPNLEREHTLHPLLEQTEAFIQHHPEVDLIVWPELPIIFSWQERRHQQRLINNMLSKINKPLILNSGYVYPKIPQHVKSGQQYYSTAQLVSAKGELQGSYSKQKLVPFFEYLPYEAQWPEIRNYFPNGLRYIPGVNQSPVNLPVSESNAEQTISIAPLICYEMIFSQFPRKLKEQNAEVFINPSNDTWFSGTSGSIRHFALALFRSVENRTPWVRVNNSGISGATTAYGEIIENSLTSNGTKESKIVSVKLNKGGTFYTRFGDVFLYFIALASLLFLIRQLRAK